jgi:hypothetical protein
LPRGAQVERTLGVRLNPDSSKKQMTAWRRLAFFDPGPVDLDPVVDGGLVTFGRAAAGTLHTPAESMVQDRPEMGGVVAQPGQPLDHQRDALQGPQLAGKPVGHGPLQQRRLDRVELVVGQPRCQA